MHRCNPKRPALTKNADILISSFDCNYVSIIELLETEMGDKFTVYQETAEEQIKMGVPVQLVTIREMLLDGRGVVTRGGYKVWNEKFPEVKATTLEEVVRRSVKELTE